jgi:citrate synthase
MEEVIVTYMITKGGIWGLLLSMSLFWIIFREKMLSDSGKKKSAEIEAKESSEEKLSRLASDYNDLKINQNKTIKKLADIQNAVESVQILIKNDNLCQDREEKLTEQLRKVNDERVTELKELLTSYSKNMTELSIALEKIKYALRNKNNHGD